MSCGGGSDEGGGHMGQGRLMVQLLVFLLHAESADHSLDLHVLGVILVQLAHADLLRLALNVQQGLPYIAVHHFHQYLVHGSADLDQHSLVDDAVTDGSEFLLQELFEFVSEFLGELELLPIAFGPLGGHVVLHFFLPLVMERQLSALSRVLGCLRSDFSVSRVRLLIYSSSALAYMSLLKQSSRLCWLSLLVATSMKSPNCIWLISMTRSLVTSSVRATLGLIMMCRAWVESCRARLFCIFLPCKLLLAMSESKSNFNCCRVSLLVQKSWCFGSLRRRKTFLGCLLRYWKQESSLRLRRLSSHCTPLSFLARWGLFTCNFQSYRGIVLEKDFQCILFDLPHLLKTFIPARGVVLGRRFLAFLMSVPSSLTLWTSSRRVLFWAWGICAISCWRRGSQWRVTGLQSMQVSSFLSLPSSPLLACASSSNFQFICPTRWFVRTILFFLLKRSILGMLDTNGLALRGERAGGRGCLREGVAVYGLVMVSSLSSPRPLATMVCPFLEQLLEGLAECPPFILTMHFNPYYNYSKEDLAPYAFTYRVITQKGNIDPDSHLRLWAFILYALCFLPSLNILFLFD